MDSSLVAAYSQLEQTHWWFVVRRRIIEQVFEQHTTNPLKESPRILNIGAASGFSSQWLSRFGEVTSVEQDADFLKYLRGMGRPVVEASAECLPFADGQFDWVCAFDVLEHLSDDGRGMAEMFRVCKTGGLVFVAVPAFNGLWSPHDEVNGHQRRYTLRSLRALLHDQTSRVLWSSYFNTLLFLPIALVRKFQGLFRRKETTGQSDFEYYRGTPFVNALLKRIFSLEPFWLKKRRFPFGVSLLLLARKTTHASEGNQDRGKDPNKQ